MPLTEPLEAAAATAVLHRLGMRSDVSILSSLTEAVNRLAPKRKMTKRAYGARCLQEPLESEFMSELAEMMSVGESSFFRHRSHFDAVEKTILPALRDARRHEGARVLSAGCAKGEELYSLAISCEKAWPEGRHCVVGFDVNESSLRAATAGRYGRWSMRGLDPAALAPWLSAVEPELWQVSPALRRTVRLISGNLLVPLQREALGTFDLIFCRNVLLYFNLEAGRLVATALAQMLTPGGLLVVGPADHDFCAELTCFSIDGVYCYSLKAAAELPRLPEVSLIAAPRLPETSAPPAKLPFARASGVTARPPTVARYEALLAEGRAARDVLAEDKQQEAALLLFDRAIALMPERPEAYFEQALLLDQRRLFKVARELLERALSLDPCFTPAVLLLSRVLQATEQMAQARALLENLETALADMPASAPVCGWSQMTAGSLRKTCRRLLYLGRAI